MGFSVGASQCLIAPPYAFAAIIMYISGMIGDKHHIRGPLVIFNAVLSIIGLAVMGFVKSTGVRYFAGMTYAATVMDGLLTSNQVFLACAGANANVPTVMAYQVRTNLSSVQCTMLKRR